MVSILSIITIVTGYGEDIFLITANFKFYLRIMTSRMTKTTVEGIGIHFIEPGFYLTGEIRFRTSFPCGPCRRYILTDVKPA